MTRNKLLTAISIIESLHYFFLFIIRIIYSTRETLTSVVNIFQMELTKRDGFIAMRNIKIYVLRNAHSNDTFRE